MSISLLEQSVVNEMIFAILYIASSSFYQSTTKSKIPAARDLDGPGGKHINLFESGSIVLYLAEKYGRFYPADPVLRTEILNWVFWQV